MKKAIARAAITIGTMLFIGIPTLFAQTTYQASNVPFSCQAATAAPVALSFGMFNCRGLFYDNGNAELFFTGSSVEIFTKYGWNLYSGSVTLISFTQPNPNHCPVIMPGYHTGCPSGTTPGTLTFNWSGTGTDGLVHSGSVSATWINEQICGGERCWYHPILDTAPLTINN